MISKFKNPSGNISLSKADADEYKGTLYWQYYDVKPNGNCYFPPKKMFRDFDFTTASERHAIPFDACKGNQMLVESPKINAGASRFFEDEEYTVWEQRGSRTVLDFIWSPPSDPNDTVEVTDKQTARLQPNRI